MKVSVEAVVQNGELKLKKPISSPDDTKALVSSLTDTLRQDDAKEWAEQYYQRTKNLILDKQFEKTLSWLLRQAFWKRSSSGSKIRLRLQLSFHRLSVTSSVECASTQFPAH